MKRISLEVPENDINCLLIHKETEVNVTDKLEEPPIAISAGWYTHSGEQKRIAFGSYGDFSCIVGASKSMKTKLKTAIVASYVGGRSNNYFDNFQGVESEGKYIIDLDTEQSKYHVKRCAKEVRDMVGAPTETYKSFSLRGRSVDERVAFLKWIMLESEYAGNIGLICVDGAADLVHSVNDELASYELAQLFLQLTAASGAHLITILHKNSSGGKPTGHLGSAILKKAETVAFLQRQDEGIITVTPDYTRNYPFRSFNFTLNERYLPIMEDLNDSIFEDQ